MLDIKRIREDYDNVKAAVEKRCKGDFGLSEVPGLDSQRREILLKVEQMKNRQNTVSKEIPKLKKSRRRYCCRHGRDERTFRRDKRTGREANRDRKETEGYAAGHT